MVIRFVSLLKRVIRRKKLESEYITQAQEEAIILEDPKHLLGDNKPKAPMTLNEVLNIQGWCTFIKFPMMKEEELIEKLKKAFSKNIEDNKRYLMF